MLWNDLNELNCGDINFSISAKLKKWIIFETYDQAFFIAGFSTFLFCL